MHLLYVLHEIANEFRSVRMSVFFSFYLITYSYISPYFIPFLQKDKRVHQQAIRIIKDDCVEYKKRRRLKELAGNQYGMEAGGYFIRNIQFIQQNRRQHDAAVSGNSSKLHSAATAIATTLAATLATTTTIFTRVLIRYLEWARNVCTDKQ